MTTDLPDPRTTAAPPLSDADDREWGAIAHFGGAALAIAVILGFVGVGGTVQALVALLAALPSLVILLTLGRRGRRTRTESREALDFVLTVLGALLIWIVVSTVALYLTASALNANYVAELPNELVPPTDPRLAIGTVRMWLGIPTVLIAGFGIVFSVIAGVTVHRGGSYRYPVAIRFLR